MGLREILSILIFSLFLSCTDLFGQDALTVYDRLSIRDARDCSSRYGEKLWDNFDEPPFSLLLVGSETEFLIDHYYQPDDFSRQLYDTVFHSTIHLRPLKESQRQSTHEFHGLFTITYSLRNFQQLNREEKLLFLLGERMHQYQFSSERYFLELERLEIFDDSIRETGEFHYTIKSSNSIVSEAFKDYLEALKNTFNSLDTELFDNEIRTFVMKRNNLKRVVEDSDDTYFEFVKYHEGITAYTQFKILQMENSDESNYSTLKDSFYRELTQNIGEINFVDLNQTDLRTLGFVEALFLDIINSKWKSRYLDVKFDLSRFFDEAEEKWEK